MRGTIMGGIAPDLIALTGAIVTWWSRIESQLVHDIIGMRALAAVQADKQCWPVKIATKKLIAQWARGRRIWEREHPAIEKIADEIAPQLRECAEIRHRLIHGFWGWGTPNGDPDKVIISTLKPTIDGSGTLEFERYEATVAQLDAFNDRLYRLSMRLLPITIRLQAFDDGQDHNGYKDAPPNSLGARLNPAKPILG